MTVFPCLWLAINLAFCFPLVKQKLTKLIGVINMAMKDKFEYGWIDLPISPQQTL